MKTNNGINLIFEVLWLLVAIGSIGAGIHSSINYGFKNSYAFFVITVIALTLYYFRRSLRLKNNNQ